MIEEAQRALQVCKSSAVLSRHCTAMSEVIGCWALSAWIAGAPRTSLLSPLIQLLNHLPFAPSACLLQVMVDSLSPAEGLALLLPYAEQHKNPKVRGKAGGAAAAAVARMDPAGVAAYGLPRLLQAASKLVTGARGCHCFVFWCELPAMLLWRAAAVVVPCSALLCSLPAPAASILTLLLAPLNPSRRQHARCPRQRQARHRLPARRIRRPRSGGAAGV